MRISPWADLRYRRQFFELRIPLGVSVEDVDEGALRALMAHFEEDYARRYGAGARHGEHRIEYVRFGVEAIGTTPRPPFVAAELDGRRPEVALKGKREVYWREAGELAATLIYDGALLVPGTRLAGPAIIEHPGTSIAVHPGQSASIDAYSNTIIDLEEGGHADGRRSRHL
jgi:N-methylhydantoinase A